MAHTDEQELRSLCRMMIILRMICVGAVLSVVAFFYGAGLEIEGLRPIAGLLLVVFPLSAVWWLVLKTGCRFRSLIYSQLAADLALESGIVYFTGGAQSHLALLYLVTIFLGGTLLASKGAAVFATLSAGLFTAVSLLESSHARGSAAVSAGQSATTYVVLNIALQIMFFYMIAILSAYTSRRTGAFGAKLKSARSELERARMDTRLIIECMNSGLVTVGSDRKVNEFNKSASRILGIAPEEIRGKSVEEAFGTVSEELCVKILRGMEDGLEEERGEVVAGTQDGTRIPLGVSISVLKDDGGVPTGVVVVFQDLTEVKTMAERIRLADRLAALGELSAAIAHEIRTPLASICGSIEILRDSLAPEGEDGRLVDLVIKESERLRKKIDYFLEFARSRPSRFHEVRLNQVLTEVVCLVKNHPHFSEDMTVELDAGSAVSAWADEETVKQVFYNLALNAIEALGPDGRLKVTLEAVCTEETGDTAEVRFEDNGVGIDENDLNRIFEPFFTKKDVGTGLGLAIASKIVEDHGGRIVVKSQKGAGTVVTVYMPLDRMTVEGSYFGAGSSQRLVEPANIRVE
jgi:two-component system sensor histidine kinase PilS (NtrC family)